MTYLKIMLCSFISFTIIILNKDITHFVLTYEQMNLFRNRTCNENNY